MNDLTNDEIKVIVRILRRRAQDAEALTSDAPSNAAASLTKGIKKLHGIINKLEGR